MKKLFYSLSPFIAFFLGFIFLSIKANAQALPSLSPDTFTLLEGGNNALFNSGFSTESVFPFQTDAQTISSVIKNASVKPIEEGILINSVSSSQVEVRALTNDEIRNNEVLYPYLYDVNGNPVNWDDVYFAHYDNGFCHGELYIDPDGNILTANSDHTLTMFQLGLGGNILGVTDIANIYSTVADELFQQQYNISLSDTDLSGYSLSYYLHGGRVSSGRKTEWIIYVPNIYARGVSVAGSYNNGQSIGNIYYNDGSGVVAKAINTSGGQPFQVLGSVSKDGYTYAHNLQQSAYIDGSNNNRSAFDAGTTGRYNFSLTSFSYNSSLQNSASDTVAFKKLQFPENIKTLQLDDTYDYDSILELETALNTISPTIDNSFDPSSRITEINYPYDYPVTDPAPDPSPLPIPDPNPQPDPRPDPNPDPESQPEIEDIPNEQLDPSLITNNIPLITNLQTRFPFSIPWDIYNLLKGFEVPRETPYINTTITIPVVNYEWHIEYDLSAFDDIASLFRVLTLISFILGLAYFSYDHFFGK